jgi:hypothetical protein
MLRFSPGKVNRTSSERRRTRSSLASFHDQLYRETISFLLCTTMNLRPSCAVWVIWGVFGGVDHLVFAQMLHLGGDLTSPYCHFVGGYCLDMRYEKSCLDSSAADGNRS